MARAQWNGEQIAAAIESAGEDALERAAAHLLAQSQQIVPYETGDLSRSGDSGMVGPLRAAVTYTERGAVNSHERLDIKPANGRQRKYLETPLNRERDQVLQIIATRIRQELE